MKKQHFFNEILDDTSKRYRLDSEFDISNDQSYSEGMNWRICLLRCEYFCKCTFFIIEPSSSVRPDALENSFSHSCSVVDENQDSSETDDIPTG